MQWHLIESDSTLETVLERFAGAPAVAVDTEFMRRNTFFPEVALVQLCFGDEAWHRQNRVAPAPHRGRRYCGA